MQEVSKKLLRAGTHLPGIEFLTSSNVLSTRGTPNTKRNHHSDLELVVLGSFCPRDKGGVKIGWIILVEDLTFTHLFAACTREFFFVKTYSK